MSLIVSEKSGSYQLPPEGMHVARCIRIIDLGTQPSNFGDGKPSRRVMLYWELSEEKAVFDPERGEEPFIVHKEYNATIGSKSNLRHDLESWRGHGFRGSETVGFDLAVMLGKTCLINVIHETSATGRKYHKIIGVTPLPKGMQSPPQILPSLRYLIEDGEGGVFGEVSGWLQEKIRGSEELSGKRPTKTEIVERNVRQASANAIAEQDESGETDDIFDLNAYSDADLRKLEVVNEIREIIENLPCSNAEKANQYQYLNQLVRRAKANAPAVTSDEVEDIDALNAKLAAEVNGGELE